MSVGAMNRQVVGQNIAVAVCMWAGSDPDFAADGIEDSYLKGASAVERTVCLVAICMLGWPG